MDESNLDKMDPFSEGVVLITGGTGSFGQTMARYLIKRGCPQVRILSRDEAKQDAMRVEFRDSRLRFYLGDVRDLGSIQAAMSGSDMVFHAAALKQVPSCDFFPMQAVLTNVSGSANVLESADRHGVKSVVCLSTDKAVYPVNAMGMTKALMEKLAHATARRVNGSGPVVSCVRYGNVMYSRGSVIPLFIQCIREGRNIPITYPGMTRFMLPLSQAVELVEFALTRADAGDLFIRTAPACTIGDLASAVVRLFRAESEVDVIGFRHGEKLYETLATKEELRRSEDLGGYLRVRMDDRDLNYGKYVEEGDPLEAGTDDYNSHNTYRLSVDEIERLLASLPEVQAELLAAHGDIKGRDIVERVCTP